MMRLARLIDGLEVRLAHGPDDVEVADLTDDSRQATPGCAFLARPGEEGGPAGDEALRRYVADAVARGAAAIIAPADLSLDLSDPVALATGPRIDQALAGHLAERFFDHPSRKLALVGVTGTSGKTTTAFLIQHLLQCAGVRCGLIGTVKIDVGEGRGEGRGEAQTSNIEHRPSSLPTNTTPGAIEFSRLLAQMVANGCGAAAAEVSSHALHQGRTASLQFAVGVLTNLTGDHLDYHHTMDAYADAKAILFEQLGPEAWAVVNGEDDYAPRMAQGCRANLLWTTTSTPSPTWTRQAQATLLESTTTHTRARFAGPWGEVEVNLPLVGRHNVANALQAVAAAHAVAPQLSRTLAQAMESLPQIPGRLERVGEDVDRSRTTGNQPASSATPHIPNPTPRATLPTVGSPGTELEFAL